MTQPAAGGTVTMAPEARAWCSRPPRASLGTVTFTYTVSDGNGGTATVTVTVNVGQVDSDGDGLPDDEEEPR